MPFSSKYSKFIEKSMKNSDRKTEGPLEGLEETLFGVRPLCYKSLPAPRKEILENGCDRALPGDQLQSPKDQ
jgi:hypothetical protein